MVTDVSANWRCCPVGFSDQAFLQMFQKFGRPEDLAISSVRYLPIVSVRSAEELKAFQEEMAPYWDFDRSYPDTFSFSEVIGRYDASFFNSSTLLLVYIPEETTANRHSVEYIRHSEGTLSVGITTLAPEAGDTSNEGWLLCIRVPSQQITGVDRFRAFVSSTQEMDKV